MIFHLPLCTSSPPLLTHWVQPFGSWGMQCPSVTMSLALGRGGVPYIYVSDVIKFLKLFSGTSELCGVKCVGSGGWRDRMWQSCRVSNKARCLVFMGKMIYAPHQQCQFMDFSGLPGEIGKIHL